MALDRVQRNTIILIVVGVVALGVMLTRVDHELTELSHTLLKISDDVRVPKSSGGSKTVYQDDRLMKVSVAKDVNQKVVKSGDKVYRFAQHCTGAVDIVEGQSVPFCVGQNQLTLIAGSDDPVVLVTADASSAQVAPVLREAIVVKSNAGAGTALLAYGPDTCITTNDCGMGLDPLNVTFAYNLAGGDSALRPIAHYPATGMSTWNPSGTRAIIVPDTCPESGCTLAALTGYDLVSDVAQPASTEQAAGAFGALKTDAAGKRVPLWGDVTWTSDTEYSVTMTDAKGKAKTITGKF